jgi:hypothetical protein
MSESILSNSVIEPKKVKAKYKRKRIVEPETPNRNNVTDFRRTFSQLLLNAFNSCDVDKLRYTLENFCVPDLYSCCKYEGINNPYASNTTETKTIGNHMTMWSALFQSAPDFLFHGEFLEAFMADDNRCVVRSRFTFRGTRVADVKVAEQVNDTVLREKLMYKSNVSIKSRKHCRFPLTEVSLFPSDPDASIGCAIQFPTTENELMAQIHRQLAESYTECAEDLLSETPDSLEAYEEELRCADLDVLPDFGVPREIIVPVMTSKSLFYGKDVNLTEPGVKMYAETNLHTKGMALRCAGTLTVYVNNENKITEFEFLYTAMDTGEF